jgi:hypothetical protein
VVVVDAADARVVHAAEPEAGLDRAVAEEAEVGDVAVPAGLELRDETDVAAGNPVRDALEVAGVGAVLENDRGRSRALADAGCDVGAGRREETFLVLPVAVRPQASLMY